MKSIESSAQSSIDGEEQSSSASAKAKANYRTVWRWHFYAGLIVTPVVLLLAITGAIYLFKPHLEPVLYGDIWFTQNTGSPASLAEQLEIVKKANPSQRVSGVSLFEEPTRTTEFSFRTSGQTKLVYVDPYSLAVTGTIDRDRMLMRRVRNLHGELMLGRFGSAIVEMAACWTVVLLVSGLYLWWPFRSSQGKSRFLGAFWPRIGQGKRIFWRDVHAVTAVYGSIVILTLIMTGLPWSNVWGGLFKQSLAISGQAQPTAARRGASFLSTSDSGDRIPLSKVIQIAAGHSMTGDLKIGMPRGKKGAYSIAQRPLDLTAHRFLHLDQYTGEVVAKATWDDFPIGGALQTGGIRLHQGELFGTANLIIMLLACIGLIVIAVSGITMWWIRRPQGRFAAPPTGTPTRELRPMIILTLVFALLFPLVGISIVIFATVDWLTNSLRSA